MGVEGKGLELHILGGSEGESIILRCPDGNWGVIDCFNPSLKSIDDNPTVSFLRERLVKRLAFACVTHPHADHYRGMYQVVKLFRPEKFWITLSDTLPDLLAMLSELENTVVAELAESLLESECKEALPNYTQLVELIRGMYLDGSMEIEALSDLTELYPKPFSEMHEFTIRGLGPFERSRRKYRNAMMNLTDAAGNFKPDFPILDHNLISSAFLVKYGHVAILLGGDVEEEGWEEILKNRTLDRAKSLILKVSHHGSLNGCPDVLIERIKACCSGSIYGIVTAFSKKNLPTEGGVEKICSFVKHLSTTSSESLSPSRALKHKFEKTTPLLVEVAIRTAFSKWKAKKVGTSRGRCSFVISPDGRIMHEVHGAALKVI